MKEEEEQKEEAENKTGSRLLILAAVVCRSALHQKVYGKERRKRRLGITSHLDLL